MLQLGELVRAHSYRLRGPAAGGLGLVNFHSSQRVPLLYLPKGESTESRLDGRGGGVLVLAWASHRQVGLSAIPFDALVVDLSNDRE